MQTAGYVLAGGASRRMGTDKALLPFRGATLIESVARAVRDATGSITIVGPPEKYQGLAMRVIADLRASCGPLAGIETALADSNEEWILVAACDMPNVTGPFFFELLKARTADVQAVIPVTPDGRPHPLAGIYHRSAAPVVTSALDHGVRKVLEAINVLNVKYLSVSDLTNTNTPDEWATVTD